jgi:hypothetical protein
MIFGLMLTYPFTSYALAALVLTMEPTDKDKSSPQRTAAVIALELSEHNQIKGHAISSNSSRLLIAYAAFYHQYRLIDT